MSVPTDNNTSIKEDNKISKYKNLQIEIVKLCHFKTTTVPVIDLADVKYQKIVLCRTALLLSMWVKTVIQKKEQNIST